MVKYWSPQIDIFLDCRSRPADAAATKLAISEEFVSPSGRCADVITKASEVKDWNKRSVWKT